MEGSAQVYEIRICNFACHASMIMMAECEDDIAAILIARRFTRRNEGAEVWRDDSFVYRLAPRMAVKTARPAKPKPLTASHLNLQWWFQCLVNAVAIRNPHSWLNP